jgi:YidC/Oxa1 family membrane protein insertase
MISDWSGAALEYAFGLERPVVFIDVPRKVLNPHYQELSAVPMEVSLREEIGAVVPVDSLDQVPSQIERLCGDPSGQRERLRSLREKWVYNVGRSGAVGAEYIAGAADRELSAPVAKT